MAHIPPAEQLLALKGSKLPVLDFLALFKTRVRNDADVLVIRQALKDAGLPTLPDFATCGRLADVHVVELSSVPDAEQAAQEDQEDADDEGLTAGALPQRPFQIGDLPAACGGLESVSPSDLLTDVMYFMQTKNYSQVPVMDDHYTLRGVVTWQSVVNMYATRAQGEWALANAMVPDPPVAEAHQDFFSLLPMICEYGYLLVRGNNGRFSGIVTAADITERFETTAWPFFIVGEIEFRLRKCLGKLSEEAIRAVQPDTPDRQTGKITDLMFGEYVKLLDSNARSNKQKELQRASKAVQNWKDLGWPGVSHTHFVRQLDRVRDIRNKIAHFSPDPLSQQRADELREFVRILRQLP